MTTVDKIKNALSEAAQDVQDRAMWVRDQAVATGEKVREMVRGAPDVLQLLKRDHELVSSLFAQIEALEGKGEEDRESFFAQLKYELSTHALAEERVFYPVLTKGAKGRDLMSEAFEEHRVLKRLLVELAAVPMNNTEWKAKLTVLKEIVEHHVREEENDLFKLAREVMDEKQLLDLGARLEQEKQSLATGGKPDEADDAAALQGGPLRAST